MPREPLEGLRYVVRVAPTHTPEGGCEIWRRCAQNFGNDATAFSKPSMLCTASHNIITRSSGVAIGSLGSNWSRTHAYDVAAIDARS